jgi:hypothetical protein
VLERNKSHHGKQDGESWERQDRQATSAGEENNVEPKKTAKLLEILLNFGFKKTVSHATHLYVAAPPLRAAPLTST